MSGTIAGVVFAVLTSVAWAEADDSDDDGKTWTAPVVVARRSAGGLSYPYLFEPKPGELWVFTRFSFQVKLRLRESDFVRP